MLVCECEKKQRADVQQGSHVHAGTINAHHHLTQSRTTSHHFVMADSKMVPFLTEFFLKKKQLTKHS